MSDYYKCPKCETKCDEETIYSCTQLRCPKCGTEFEPEEIKKQ